MNMEQLEHNTDSLARNDIVKVVFEESLANPQPVVVKDATRNAGVLSAVYLVEKCCGSRNGG